MFWNNKTEANLVKKKLSIQVWFKIFILEKFVQGIERHLGLTLAVSPISKVANFACTIEKTVSIVAIGMVMAIMWPSAAFVNI